MKKNTFDEWLEDDVKEEILEDLKQKWENITQGNCVFVSATERRNIDELTKHYFKQSKGNVPDTLSL